MVVGAATSAMVRLKPYATCGHQRGNSGTVSLHLGATARRSRATSIYRTRTVRLD